MVYKDAMDLREYLDARNLSQRDLARRAGLDESQLSRLLRGKLRVMPEDALRLHEATDREVSLEEILRLSIRVEAATA